MSKKFVRFFLVSIGLHMMVALFFYLQKTDKSSPEIPIALEYKTEPSEKAPRGSSASKPKLAKLLPKKLNPGQFKIGPIRSTEADLIGMNGKNGSGGNANEEVPAFTSPVQTLQDAIELDPFYRALWSRVAAAAQYPEDFSKHYISGSVSVRMEVDHRGVITKRKLAVESDNPYLETLVLYTLIKVLKEPLNSKYWITASKIPVTFTLRYVQRLPDDPREASPGSIAGHHLEVIKYDYIVPETYKKIDEFITTYVPPIIPVPGGFYIDFIHAYKMIKKIQEPDQNDMRTYRVEAIEESMERFIRKEQSEDAS